MEDMISYAKRMERRLNFKEKKFSVEQLSEKVVTFRKIETDEKIELEIKKELAESLEKYNLKKYFIYKESNEFYDNKGKEFYKCIYEVQSGKEMYLETSINEDGEIKNKIYFNNNGIYANVQFTVFHDNVKEEEIVIAEKILHEINNFIEQKNKKNRIKFLFNKKQREEKINNLINEIKSKLEIFNK